jgi:hypothetical protein
VMIGLYPDYSSSRRIAGEQRLVRHHRVSADARFAERVGYLG